MCARFPRAMNSARPIDWKSEQRAEPTDSCGIRHPLVRDLGTCVRSHDPGADLPRAFGKAPQRFSRTDLDACRHLRPLHWPTRVAIDRAPHGVGAREQLITRALTDRLAGRRGLTSSWTAVDGMKRLGSLFARAILIFTATKHGRGGREIAGSLVIFGG